MLPYCMFSKTFCFASWISVAASSSSFCRSALSTYLRAGTVHLSLITRRAHGVIKVYQRILNYEYCKCVTIFEQKEFRMETFSKSASTYTTR